MPAVPQTAHTAVPTSTPAMAALLCTRVSPLVPAMPAVLHTAHTVPILTTRTVVESPVLLPC